jgi:hypothetical protein
MSQSLISKFRFFTIPRVLFPVPALLVLATTAAYAHWPDNPNRTKYVQWPDTSTKGFDVLATQGPPGPTGGLPIILADDFQCTETGPVTDIHLWISWLGFSGATTLPPVPITLGIWTDVPATIGPGGGLIPSHPGQLLWTNTFVPGFGPGTYSIKFWSAAQERFWDPELPPPGILGADNAIWQYNFYPPATNTFTQRGMPSTPVMYWLSMTAVSLQTGAAGPFIGWKTATNQVYDNAVFGHVNAAGNPVGDWQPLIDPTLPTRNLDLSFVLTTTNIHIPPTPVTNKWVQFPDTNGFDINAVAPFIVADDFQCTNSGPITNIQIWASFRDDATLNPNLTITLGIWTDIPKSPPSIAGNIPFSRPGRLLCNNVFKPGDYTVTFVGTGREFFYDPTTGQITPETRIYLYNFDLKNPCCQHGTVAAPITYWLSVSATAPPGIVVPFGWKTSTNHWNDDAVFGTPTATGVFSWQELFDPIVTAAKVSLDMAFVVNSGPSNPDCDPHVHTKWLQPPDVTTNGLDVLATATNVMGDDFLCKSPGPISGITVWGSWKGDKVDTNAVFQLSLWTDVPADPATGTGFSHPGSVLCTTLFYPPQTSGTWLDRYHVSLYNDHVSESFYNPDLGAAGGIIGNDTQIWRYDFYPNQFGQSCWHQDGSPFNAGITYWIVLSYLPAAGTVNPDLFGWKTSTIHRKDDAVYGHLNANNVPLGDWKDLHDPHTGLTKDLAFALHDFTITSVNKDLINTSGAAVDGIQVVIPGDHIITAHYDGSWPTFTATKKGGDTVLQWTGQAIAPNGITHVGWEYPGTAAASTSINWMLGGVVLPPPLPQVNFTVRTNLVIVVNDISQGSVMVNNGIVEFHSGPISLDQMNPNGQRPTPIEVAQLTPPPEKMPPGGAMILPLPPPPPAARYAMLMVGLSDPAVTPTVTDFVLVPLDPALQPVIDSVSLGEGGINLSFSSVPGRTYNVQYKADVTSPSWSNSALGDIPADTAETTVVVPFTGAQSFYRVALLPD